MASDFFEDPGAAAALLVRLSIQSTSVKQVARRLDKSDSLIHKWTEDEEAQAPNLEQWLKTLAITRDFDGVRRLAKACGFVCVRRGATLSQALRELAEELESAPEERSPVLKVKFP
jgi:hypothetical protein